MDGFPAEPVKDARGTVKTTKVYRCNNEMRRRADTIREGTVCRVGRVDDDGFWLR